MPYKAREVEINPQNYLVMDRDDFDSFIINYKLPVFKDDDESFTYWNGLQIIRKFEKCSLNR